MMIFHEFLTIIQPPDRGPGRPASPEGPGRLQEPPDRTGARLPVRVGFRQPARRASHRDEQSDGYSRPVQLH